MFILNRLRGMYGIFSKVIGLLLSVIIFLITSNYYVALSVGVLYIVGECFKWGDALGALTDTREKLWHYRVWLFFRGIIWWACLIPLIWFIDFYVIVTAIILLAILFPVACEIGYNLAKWKTIPKYLPDGWAWQEIVYGVFQDIILVSLYFYYVGA